jgi:hypothetical protein
MVCVCFRGLVAAVAKGTRDGGIPRASVNAIFPNVKVMSKATITAVVVNHGSTSGIQYQEIERRRQPVQRGQVPQL